MSIQRYNKALAAVVVAGLLVAQTLWPGQTPLDNVTEEEAREWVDLLLAVLSPILVWAVPNRDGGK